MLTEIVVTSPDKEATKIIEQVQSELNMFVSIIETSFESAVSLIKDIISNDPDRIKVILSGGATLELLRQELPFMQMISIHPTEYEIVLALDKAKATGEKIGLFIAGTEDPTVVRQLSYVLGLNVKIYVYKSWMELENQMAEARKDGIQVILGVGERIKNLVKRFGLIYVSVSAGKKTIKNALTQARDFLEARLYSKVQEPKHKRELLAKGFRAKYTFNDIIYVNRKMAAIIEKTKKYSNTDCTILIRGESGTGKELLAQSIHNEHYVRRKEPFVAVNCASFDDNLFKSELFGYAEGSFTGAIKGGKPGLFELANGGTLFLDEIGKMKFEQQGNLLRVLQEKEVRRIGSDRVVSVDVRIIAASNEDLTESVRKGTFREDLYFRLSVLKVVLPPLRERREDIPDQVILFVRKFSKKYSKTVYSLPAYVLKRLSNLDWPGNSRQLQNLVERCVVLANNEKDASTIMLELIDEEFIENNFSADSKDGNKDKISVCISTLAEMNTEIVRRMRATAKLSNSELALKLGISRPTLSKMLNYN
ncbi:sigma-54-dependent Fis family transcriptional regulator [Desulfosporosinus sp. FKB]|uniref:sigma-54-dependent Fis family transcriptional regulator n=1 Tax=Desulfosporosinus sp. FKB TaxID=1969835 RepID=UPI000B499B8A|nr:sigma-54-dependent Fis family transcriptional regulator [Desulfosporosinus sp. FKB]